MEYHSRYSDGLQSGLSQPRWWHTRADRLWSSPGLVHSGYRVCFLPHLAKPLLTLFAVMESHSYNFIFLGAFAKLRQVTISFVMSVCPHGRTRLPPDWFWWNLIFSLFRKSVEKIHVVLKSDKNNGYFTWRRFHIYFFLEWKNFV